MKSLREASALCVTCPRLCHSACPTAEVTGSGALSGWGLSNLAHAIATDTLPRSERGSALDALATCSSCGRCSSFCRSHVDIPAIIEEARRTLLQTEPLPPGTRQALNRPMAHKVSTRSRREMKMARWVPGCMSGSGLSEDTSSALAALLALASNQEWADPEPVGACGGGLARRAGALPKREVKEKDPLRVFGCFNCLHDGLEPGSHWVAWLDDRREVLEELYEGTGLPEVSLTLHEGCGRGARLNASAAARLLKSVGVSVELLRDSMDQPPCCGGDPLQRADHPDIADAITANFPEVGPTVTMKSNCAKHLRTARGLDVQSLAEVILWRTGIQPEPS